MEIGIYLDLGIGCCGSLAKSFARTLGNTRSVGDAQLEEANGDDEFKVTAAKRLRLPSEHLNSAD